MRVLVCAGVRVGSESRGAGELWPAAGTEQESEPEVLFPTWMQSPKFLDRTRLRSQLLVLGFSMSPALAFAAILGVNQRVENLPLSGSPSLCKIFQIKISNHKKKQKLC